MSLETRLYRLIVLRRRTDRKILLKVRWSLRYSVRHRLEIFFRTKDVRALCVAEKELYVLLNKKIKTFAEKNSLIKTASAIKIESVDTCELIPRWFEDLKLYDKRLRDLGAVLIIQGSYADSRITNYSDIDLVIFYKPYSKKVLEIKKEIEVFLLRIDPLQHHGIFMIDQNTFGYYWQMDLPIQVLNKAKCFTNKLCELNITGILTENLGSLYATKSTIIVIQNFLKKDFQVVGLWEWKFFLSQLLLLPTLVLGGRGNYIYKRDSFDVFKNMVSPKAWYCIEKASKIRNAWPNIHSMKVYENLRNSVVEKPYDDSIQAIQFNEISVANDAQFSNSLQALIKETEGLIAND